jgi:hypothetical protein
MFERRQVTNPNIVAGESGLDRAPIVFKAAAKFR